MIIGQEIVCSKEGFRSKFFLKKRQSYHSWSNKGRMQSNVVYQEKWREVDCF
jgi:hypothetical protein